MQKVGAVGRKPSVLFICGMGKIDFHYRHIHSSLCVFCFLKGKGKMMLQANYKKKCKGPLIVSIVLIIGVLAYCKYTNMLIDLWNQVRGLAGNKRIDTLKLIVPLGISYYTFSSVGYLLDIYWRKKKYEK